MRPALLFRQDTLTAVAAFTAGLFPPDFSPEFLRTVAKAIAQTIAVAVAGTFLSLVIALPLSVLATATLWREGILAAGERHGAASVLMAAITRLIRAVLGFLRAVPDLVWALMFVAAVGLGSLAGALALGVAYSGVLGRVYADVFESVNPQPLEALQSTGATRAQIFLRGIWPQALPNVTGYTLYSFECCVRAASVLGFVGAVFLEARALPQACEPCAFRESCRGGCAGRRRIQNALLHPDCYCPVLRGEAPKLEVRMAAGRDLPKSESSCTTIVIARD